MIMTHHLVSCLKIFLLVPMNNFPPFSWSYAVTWQSDRCVLSQVMPQPLLFLVLFFVICIFFGRILCDGIINA